MPYLRKRDGEIVPLVVGDPVAVIAGSVGDGVAVRRTVYKRIDNQIRPQCAIVALEIQAVLAEDETLTLTPAVVTDSVDTYNADPATVQTFDAITLTGGTGGSTETYHWAGNVDLAACDDCVALQFTPALSADDTDTAVIAVLATQTSFDAEVDDQTAYCDTNRPVLAFAQPALPEADVFAFISGKVVLLTAGGTGDNTAVTRSIYEAVTGEAVPRFATVALNIMANLAEAKTLKLTPTIITDADDTYASPVVVETLPEITLTGDTGGSVEVLHWGKTVDLSALQACTAIRFTPNLNATDTDVAAIAVVVAQSKFDEPIVPAAYGLANHPDLDLELPGA